MVIFASAAARVGAETLIRSVCYKNGIAVGTHAKWSFLLCQHETEHHLQTNQQRIGGFFNGYETRTYTVDADRVYIDIEHSLYFKPSNIGDCAIEKKDKGCLFESLKKLHIGGWRKNYSTKRFGYLVCDGTQWHLEIFYSNGHKPEKIYGDNAYPYNFNRLLELFEIENEYDII